MDAKEYFESIRAEVVSTERAREMLERMKAKEGAKSQGYHEGTGGGDASDPMESVAKRIDLEAIIAQRIADAEVHIDEACDLLYGTDGRGGLAKLKGNQYADVICMAYCQAEPWSYIAEVMQCSQQWCRTLSNAGFMFIDRVGWAHLRNA